MASSSSSARTQRPRGFKRLRELDSDALYIALHYRTEHDYDGELYVRWPLPCLPLSLLPVSLLPLSFLAPSLPPSTFN